MRATTTSPSNLLLIIMYFLIDMKHAWGGAPFRYIGMNSIGIFQPPTLSSTSFRAAVSAE